MKIETFIDLVSISKTSYKGGREAWGGGRGSQGEGDSSLWEYVREWFSREG